MRAHGLELPLAPGLAATCQSALHSDWYEARWMSPGSQVTSARHLLATDNEYDQHRVSKILLIRGEALDWCTLFPLSFLTNAEIGGLTKGRSCSCSGSLPVKIFVTFFFLSLYSNNGAWDFMGFWTVIEWHKYVLSCKQKIRPENNIPLPKSSDTFFVGRYSKILLEGSYMWDLRFSRQWGRRYPGFWRHVNYSVDPNFSERRTI